MIFKNYKEYKQHVYEMWKEGYMEELIQNKLIMFDGETGYKVDLNNGLSSINTVSYRVLTKDEYKEKYGK